MKSVLRIFGILVVSYLIGVFNSYASIAFFGFQPPYDFLTGVITGVLVAILLYKSTDKVMDVVKYMLGGWGIGFILGFGYMMLFHNHEAQGIMIPLIFSGPICGILGLIYAVFQVKYVIRQPQTEI